MCGTANQVSIHYLFLFPPSFSSSLFLCSNLYYKGEIVESFTIITTDAPDSIAPIHNRMPAIVNEANMNTWLDPSTPVDSAIKCLNDPTNIESLVSL